MIPSRLRRKQLGNSFFSVASNKSHSESGTICCFCTERNTLCSWMARKSPLIVHDFITFNNLVISQKIFIGLLLVPYVTIKVCISAFEFFWFTICALRATPPLPFSSHWNKMEKENFFVFTDTLLIYFLLLKKLGRMETWLYSEYALTSGKNLRG